MTRTFIALDLSEAARATLHNDLRRLARGLPDVRFVDPASLHLTLAFLGELDDEALAAVIALAGEVARHAAPFELALAGLGVFGPTDAPRVIWAGVGGELRSLLALQRRLADALVAEGFPREQRPFSPHLTLARLKRPLDEAARQRLRALLGGPSTRPTRWRVADLRVMRSELAATGARYTALSVAPLAGGAGASR
ncbi:MAG TPA: RNA 2',3'-cyclic phosphodiesterase [Ktedonobacterales bacterium]|jgi:2'-5' RNA ligase